MKNVADTTKKSNKAFRATVYEAPGTLLQDTDGVIWFMPDAGAMVPFEVEMAPWTTILAEVGLYQTQAIMDHIHGGPVGVACGREMGRN